MDEALVLARAQFGLNIGFHILFPSITIGLAWMLFVFRLRYERTRDPAWLATYKLWVKIFALCFAMGVVTGVVMSFQFGTNWPGYMNNVGNVAGPLLADEVLTAFFLEATFLAVMLFGMNRVPGWVHVASTFIVAFGTTVSAFWILALNSWMQTPAGYVHDAAAAGGGDLQSLVSLPFHAHAARLGHHRLVPARRVVGLAPAQGARRFRCARHAALRRARRRRARAAADHRR
jgi:cytochrome d ubiquinol oxidase subunit I